MTVAYRYHYVAYAMEDSALNEAKVLGCANNKKYALGIIARHRAMCSGLTSSVPRLCYRIKRRRISHQSYQVLYTEWQYLKSDLISYIRSLMTIDQSHKVIHCRLINMLTGIKNVIRSRSAAPGHHTNHNLQLARDYIEAHIDDYLE